MAESRSVYPPSTAAASAAIDRALRLFHNAAATLVARFRISPVLAFGALGGAIHGVHAVAAGHCPVRESALAACALEQPARSGVTPGMARHEAGHHVGASRHALDPGRDRSQRQSTVSDQRPRGGNRAALWRELF